MSAHRPSERCAALADADTPGSSIVDRGVDHLTGALRRGVGMAAIERELDRTRRSGESLTLAFLDVDGLKTINDTHGHPAGDDVLRTVVTCVTDQLRSSDVITRFGGDEFVVALPGQDAISARRRFRDIADRLSGHEHKPSFCVCFAERAGAESLDQLIVRADTAVVGTRRARGV